MIDNCIRLLIGGDYRPKENLLEGGSFRHLLFNDLMAVMPNFDFSIFNLETVICTGLKTHLKTGEHISALPSTLDLFSENRTILTLANNHIYDFGEEGLDATIKELVQRNIKYVGAGSSIKAASSPLRLIKNNTRIAILNYCEREFSTADIYYKGANPFDVEKVYYDIQKLKEEKYNIIVIYHGNIEYYLYPSPKLKKRFRFLIELGADVVFCHHSHYFSGFEIYKGKPIFYGLGNFYMHNEYPQAEYFYTSYLVDLRVSSSITFEILPFYQNYKSERFEFIRGNELKKFYSLLTSLNELIIDDSKLQTQWLNYAISKKSKYYYLLKQQNKLIYQLIKRGVLKQSEISGKFLPFLLNIIRNESHREAVISLLEYELNKDKN